MASKKREFGSLVVEGCIYLPLLESVNAALKWQLCLK